MESDKVKRISTEQREVMLDFMEKHPSLGTGKFTAPDGAKHKARLLEELTALLNSTANGVTKTGDKWLKSWQDWRSDVKSKAAALRKEMNKTGGGQIPSKTKPLTPLEERLLSFLGPNVVSGHEAVNDPLTVCIGNEPEMDIPIVFSEATGCTEGGNGNFIVLPATDMQQSSNVNLTAALMGSTHMLVDTPDPSPRVTSESSGTSIDSSASASARKSTPCSSSRKRGRQISETLNEDDLTLARLSEKQVNLDKAKHDHQVAQDLKGELRENAKLEELKTQTRIAQETLELKKSQSTAVITALSAFTLAMKAIEKHFSKE